MVVAQGKIFEIQPVDIWKRLINVKFFEPYESVDN